MSSRLLILIPLLLAGCQSATAPTQSLSKAEALKALRALQGVSGAAGTGSPAAAITALPEGTLSNVEALEFATACPAGGRYEAVAERGAAGGNGIVLLDMQERFLGCTVTDAGQTWRFDGDPSLRTRIVLRLADRVGAPTTMTTAYTGAFRVETDGKSARCAADLRFVLEVETVTGRVEGTFCGYPIDAADAVVLPSAFPLRR